MTVKTSDMIVRIHESKAPSSGSSLFTKVISASVTGSDFELEKVLGFGTKRVEDVKLTHQWCPSRDRRYRNGQTPSLLTVRGLGVPRSSSRGLIRNPDLPLSDS